MSSPAGTSLAPDAGRATPDSVGDDGEALVAGAQLLARSVVVRSGGARERGDERGDDGRNAGALPDHRHLPSISVLLPWGGAACLGCERWERRRTGCAKSAGRSSVTGLRFAERAGSSSAGSSSSRPRCLRRALNAEARSSAAVAPAMRRSRRHSRSSARTAERRCARTRFSGRRSGAARSADAERLRGQPERRPRVGRGDGHAEDLALCVLQQPPRADARRGELLAAERRRARRRRRERPA
jgi:hypothetical protein